MSFVAARAMETPEELLGRFGLQSFRPGQREAVEAALSGRDSLVVMPTGGGKSLCYQLPALADRGLVLVVSPLIALMADQRARLERAGVRTAMLASGMPEGHNAQALRDIESGTAQIVLAAPERFASAAFREALAQRDVALFAVDEAHCVAEWGHDFRPDYLRLNDAIAALGRPTVMAATATATPRVASEIAARLGLRDWLSVRSGFDRPNLSFDVVRFEGKGALARKRAVLLHLLGDAAARPAIVYSGTRKDTDELAGWLRAEGIAAVPYHAGMGAEVRRESQEAFMDGRAEVVVATNAFGMGIDKANVRTVAHWALPTSLEAYYQEAGRAGRDGLPARAVLLAARMDLGRLIRFNTERHITVDDVRSFVGSLRGRGGGSSAIALPAGALDDRSRVLLSIAERAGAAVLQPGGGGELVVTLTGAGSPRKARQAIGAARDRGWESYRSIESFSSSAACRRRQLLDHFGDSEPGAASGRCCDVCDPDAELQGVAEAAVARSSRSRARAGGASAAGPPVDEGEFERLRAWRFERAEGKPAYTVASNAVLEEVLRLRPRGRRELLDVRGIGQAFSEKHGGSLLALLAELGDAAGGAGGALEHARPALASGAAPT